MRTLKIVGVALLIVGLVGFVPSVVLYVDYMFIPLIPGTMSVSDPVGAFFWYGFAWGLLLIVIGLVVLTRKEATVSS